MAREDRVFRKVNKVLKRVEKHIEDTKDTLEDLEIEFEVLRPPSRNSRTPPVNRQSQSKNQRKIWTLKTHPTSRRCGSSDSQLSTSSRRDHMSSQCSMLASSPAVECDSRKRWRALPRWVE